MIDGETTKRAAATVMTIGAGVIATKTMAATLITKMTAATPGAASATKAPAMRDSGSDY
jgi:hypothetical protein